MKNDKPKTPICNELLGSEYEKILHMTDTEAADIIKKMLLNVIIGRGCGKTITQLRINTAFSKAIMALGGGTPTTEPVRNPSLSGMSSRYIVIDETTFDNANWKKKRAEFLTKDFNIPDRSYGVDFDINGLGSFAKDVSDAYNKGARRKK